MNRGLVDWSSEALGQMLERVAYLTKKITENEISVLPLTCYSGTIVVVDDAKTLDQAIETIRHWDIAGIDTETRPSFRKGEKHSPALLQIAGPDQVFLFRLQKVKFASGLRSWMNNKDILKVGVALENDMPELARIGQFSPSGMVDLNVLCQQLGFESTGVRKLAAIFLGIRVSKRQQTSNWENEILSEAQQRYAATDAWICREIFLRLLGVS